MCMGVVNVRDCIIAMADLTKVETCPSVYTGGADVQKEP